MINFFKTETLAKIYLKQGTYNKALEILEYLSERHPEKDYLNQEIIKIKEVIASSKKNTKLNKASYEIPKDLELDMDITNQEKYGEESENIQIDQYRMIENEKFLNDNEILTKEDQNQKDIQELQSLFKQWFELISMQKQMISLQKISNAL